MQWRVGLGLWTGCKAYVHINVLDLLAMYVALKHFSLHLTECHVVLRTDKMATDKMAYIYHQGEPQVSPHVLPGAQGSRVGSVAATLLTVSVISLVQGEPWTLPTHRDLLCQAKGTV